MTPCHHRGIVYVADGEPYPETYGPVPGHVRAIAIGWLDPAHPYSVGSVGEDFVASLFEACRSNATARTRGWHECGFCSDGGYPTIAARGSESFPLGDAEVRVVAKNGTWLVAPTLVLHYVTEHRYRPSPHSSRP
jgi:hypothetical protein